MDEGQKNTAVFLDFTHLPGTERKASTRCFFPLFSCNSVGPANPALGMVTSKLGECFQQRELQHHVMNYTFIIPIGISFYGSMSPSATRCAMAAAAEGKT